MLSLVDPWVLGRTNLFEFLIPFRHVEVIRDVSYGVKIGSLMALVAAE